mmetsp:Transcript_14835/g.23376  ORF Transcript_14835/g.23376 Transcript_14835/m.23376 type:complete len:150 (+) Transcript_14835:22-471(+)
MSADEAAAQLESLDLNLKEIGAEEIEKVFEAVKGLKQVQNVVIVSDEGKALHSTMDSISDEELVNLTVLYTDKKTALERAITLNGKRYEVHRFFKKEGLIYGRLGKGSKDSIGAALIKNFSNAIVLVTYGFPYLSARVIPLVRAELSKF